MGFDLRFGEGFGRWRASLVLRTMQETICRSRWHPVAERYEREVKAWTDPFRRRRLTDDAHPINDFLFVYYQYSSRKLEQWHPGVGKALAGVGEHDRRLPEKFYSQNEMGDWFCDLSKMKTKDESRLVWIVDLLKRTQARKANFSCLGLHEWAMVYHGHEVRHEKTTQLRLPQSEIDAVVESRPLTCTHFDAFRFFSIDAKPFNRVTPEPDVENRPILEQPACIHANMDLYKWAFKAMPWIGSEILLACFYLAIEARAIDMRASPYDLSKYENYSPIKIETAAGRALYEREQRAIAEKAKPLREKLWRRIEAVLTSKRRFMEELDQRSPDQIV